MYTLQVFYPGSPAAVEIHEIKHGAEVLIRIPELLARHGGCDKIVVLAGASRLFAVDCKGQPARRLGKPPLVEAYSRHCRCALAR